MSPRKREITCLGHTVVGDRTWARAHLYSSFDPKTRFFTLKLKLQIGDVWAGPATALLHAHSQFAVISPPHHLLYSCYTRGHYLLGPCRHLSEQLILYRKQFLTWINRFKCSWIQLNIQKTKITASGPITSWQIDGETVTDFIFGARQGNSGNNGWLYFWGAPKSLQMVTAAMKFKDTYSLEEKLWPT